MKKKQDVLQSTEDVATVAMMLESAGLEARWSGLCVWCMTAPRDFTHEQDEMVRFLHMDYAGKKDRYYLRAVETLPRAIEWRVA